MENNFQRIGSKSNAHVGSAFENVVRKSFASKGVILSGNHAVLVGANSQKKLRKFDLGSEAPSILVECKSHKWTTGDNIPSAKITVWNEAMYYFFIAPKKYRKLLVVAKEHSTSRGATLAAYYVQNYAHLIPNDVEIWEYDEMIQELICIQFAKQAAAANLAAGSLPNSRNA